MITKFYVDEGGNYRGAFDDASLADGLIEVPTAPSDARQKYINGEWGSISTVPQKVTMRQARLALHAAGRLNDVEVAIDSLPEPPRTAARIEWDYSSEVFRNKEFVAMIGQALNLSGEDLDELFTQASLL